MFQWDGKIGPSFIVVLGLSILTGVNWLTDGKAEFSRQLAHISERVAVLETRITTAIESIRRVEARTDGVKPAAIPSR